MRGGLPKCDSLSARRELSYVIVKLNEENVLHLALQLDSNLGLFYY